MTNAVKIVELMKSFDKTEQKRFIAFVCSPLFNKKKEIEILSEQIIKSLPKIPRGTALNGKVLYKKVFKGEAYNANKWQKLLTLQVKLLEQFIAFDNVWDKPNVQKFNNLVFYRQRALTDFFEESYKELNKIHQKETVKNDEGYCRQYEMACLYYNYVTENSSNRKISLDNTILIDAAHNLEVFYLISQLKLACHSLNNQSIVRNRQVVELSKEIIEKIQQPKFADIPLLTAFYNCWMFLGSIENEVNFQNLKNLLNQELFNQHPEDEKFLYDLAMNFCALKINMGNAQYYKEIFELFQLAITKPSFYFNGYLYNDTVKNIVTVGLAIGELDWIEYFLENYKDKLHPNFRDDIYHYNLAQLAFERANYDKAFQYLQDVKFKDIFFRIDKKKTLIKIAYEKDEFNELENLLNAFDMQIWRDQVVVPEKIEAYENFVKRLKQLVNIAEFEKDKLKKLRIKLESTERITERAWLKNKVVEKLHA